MGRALMVPLRVRRSFAISACEIVLLKVYST